VLGEGPARAPAAVRPRTEPRNAVAPARGRPPRRRPRWGAAAARLRGVTQTKQSAESRHRHRKSARNQKKEPPEEALKGRPAGGIPRKRRTPLPPSSRRTPMEERGDSLAGRGA